MKARGLNRLPWLVFALILAGAIAGITYVRSTVVPFRQFAPGMTEALRRIEPSDRINRLIRRAKFDFFLAPIAGRHDQLQFAQAYQKGDEVQIIFRPATASGTVIIYAYTLHNEKALWKSEAPSD